MESFQEPGARNLAEQFIEFALAVTVGWKLLSFPVPQARAIVRAAEQELAKEDTLVRLPVQTWVIVGDIHGNLESLLGILSRLGWPPSTTYVFLGDYVDRGTHSCEVILLILSLKILHPDQVILLRGNHECPSMGRSYGFCSECAEKYSQHLFWDCMECFAQLPIAAVANGALCVHGGISGRYLTLDDIAQSEKAIDGEIDHVALDLLWSDPSTDLEEFGASPRGAGALYGAVAVARFLETNQLHRIVRAHESCPKGYEFPLGNESVVTVFSCYDYCGMKNDAAVAVLSPSGELSFSSFSQHGRVLYPEEMIRTPKLAPVETSLMEERLSLTAIEVEV